MAFTQRPQHYTTTKPGGRIRDGKACYFCVNNMPSVDYKDPTLLRRFTSSHAKIAPRRRSGVCAWHQRKLSQAIKRSRIMALMPFVIN